MSNKFVSIIVVTFKPAGQLASCLEAIRKQTHREYEIIVIDNSHSLGQQEILQYDPKARLYTPERNLYYASALNRGIEKSKGEFILCLNDDAVLERTFIEQALRGFGAGDKIGMVSGKILRQDKITIDSTGLFLSIYRTPKERGYGVLDKGQFEQPGYIFAVNGAVAFYRREMLEELGIRGEYFDPDYCLFYEDLDLAWRAHQLGWGGFYLPSAIAYHMRGASVRNYSGFNRRWARRFLPDNLHYHLVKNRYLTLIKNETLGDLLLHLPFILFYDLAVWSYILFFRPGSLKTFFKLGMPIKSAWQKRRAFRQFLQNGKT